MKSGILLLERNQMGLNTTASIESFNMCDSFSSIFESDFDLGGSFPYEEPFEVESSESNKNIKYIIYNIYLSGVTVKASSLLGFIKRWSK